MNKEHKTHITKTRESHANSDGKEDRKVDSKKSLMVLGIALLVIILVIGTVFVMSKYFFPNNNVVEYNNYVFEKFEGDKWMTQQLIRGQLYNIPFYYNPEQVLDIPVDPKSIISIRNFRDKITNGTVYITVDPYESSRVVLANIEYARILGTAYNIYNMNVYSAITEPVEGNTDIPVITCKNQSTNTFVIRQIVTDKNLISANGFCVTIESKNDTESIRVADAYAFRLLNIIQDGTDNSTITKK